jgi:hypothetical protein
MARIQLQLIINRPGLALRNESAMVKRNYKTKNMAYDMPWHDRVPYTLGDGVEVPSVTEVLSMVGNADGLINWAVMLQRNGIDWKDERNHLADIGTTAHFYVEQYIKTLQIPDMLDFGGLILTLAKPPILAFHDWFTARTVTPHATELRMVSETWEVGGTADLIAHVDGEFEVIDFKTGAKNEKNKIQVAAYVKLAKENGMNVTRGRIVHLDRQYSSKGQPQYSEIIIDEDEIDEYFVLFRAAKAIYKKMHKPKRKGKIMPLQDVPSTGEEITPGQYRVKLTAIEDGEPGQWGPTVFWCYDVYNQAGTVVKQLRNLQSAKTGYGSRAAADATVLGYSPQPGDTGAQIEAAIIGKEATAHITLNKNGYLTVESLAPLSQPGGGVAPAGESNSPF